MKGDMTTGNPAKRLFIFAIPMVLGNLIQQLYNIVDSIIVGNYVGSDSLAAVGASSSITFLFIALATGLSIGASIVISQLFGAGQYTKMLTAIKTITFTVLLISIMILLLGLFITKPILHFMNTPDNIFSDANVYLKIFFLGIVSIFMFNTINAVFNAMGLSRIPLYFLLFSALLNIILDLVFVIHYNLGVAGVAYATLISQALSSFGSFLILIRQIKKIHINEPSSWFDKVLLLKISTIAIPSIIQQSIVSIGYILVQSLVNQYGSIVIAGYTAAIKIDAIAIMPMVNIGSAMSTFAAQNIGAGKPERVKNGLKAALAMVFAIGLSITFIIFLFGENFIAAFVDSGSNQGVIEVGVEYLRVVSIFYVVFGTMNNFNGVLRGAGDMRIFMLVTLCNLGTRVFLAYLLTAITNIGSRAIWWSIPIGWTVGLIISALRYFTGKWKKKSLILTHK